MLGAWLPKWRISRSTLRAMAASSRAAHRLSRPSHPSHFGISYSGWCDRGTCSGPPVESRWSECAIVAVVSQDPLGPTRRLRLFHHRRSPRHQLERSRHGICTSTRLTSEEISAEARLASRGQNTPRARPSVPVMPGLPLQDAARTDLDVVGMRPELGRIGAGPARNRNPSFGGLRGHDRQLRCHGIWPRMPVGEFCRAGRSRGRAEIAVATRPGCPRSCREWPPGSGLGCSSRSADRVPRPPQNSTTFMTRPARSTVDLGIG
jgi:hypothetical protein